MRRAVLGQAGRGGVGDDRAHRQVRGVLGRACPSVLRRLSEQTLESRRSQREDNRPCGATVTTATRKRPDADLPEKHAASCIASTRRFSAVVLLRQAVVLARPPIGTSRMAWDNVDYETDSERASIGRDAARASHGGIVVYRCVRRPLAVLRVGAHRGSTGD
jgi:hypothetical protein